MLVRENELKQAFDQAADIGFGFVHDFAPGLLEPLRAIAETGHTSVDDWQIIEQAERPEELLTLRAILLAHTTNVDPSSNLEFVHIKHRLNGHTHWHRDITDDNLAASGYEKGRFRTGLNLFGSVELGFELDGSGHYQEVITPGTLYIMDYTHNTYHGAVPAEGQAAATKSPSNILLFTDVARYSVCS